MGIRKVHLKQDLILRINFNNIMNVKQFRSECLEAHNAYRKCHGADPVQLDETLNDGAQKWAETMAATLKFHHEDNVADGENIAYAMQSESPNGYQITKLWYDEEKDYDYATHKTKNPGKAVGHFTQVVWKSTRLVGFGIACKNQKYYAVGRYRVAGNVVAQGLYEKNVGHKTGEPSLPELKNKAAGEDTPTLGTTVETKTETYIENGVKKTKITKITTTVTKLPDGTIQTSKSTEIRTREGGPEDEATEKLEKLTM